MEENRRRHKVLIVSLYITVVILLIGFAHYGNKIKSEIDEIRASQDNQKRKHIETNQFLLSTIDWSTRRQKSILFMRDQIVAEWQRCGRDVDLQKAYHIAETNIKECEKYPHLEPLMVLALQWKESSFIDTIRSQAGAIGLNQIMPATGRLLSGFFQMAYNDKLLYDTETSTKFAAKLLDVLYAQYEDVELVLAAYNGGPWQAYYYANQKNKLHEETASYVPMIIEKWEQYKQSYNIFKLDEDLIKQG